MKKNILLAGLFLSVGFLSLEASAASNISISANVISAGAEGVATYSDNCSKNNLDSCKGMAPTAAQLLDGQLTAVDYATYGSIGSTPASVDVNGDYSWVNLVPYVNGDGFTYMYLEATSALGSGMYALAEQAALDAVGSWYVQKDTVKFFSFDCDYASVYAPNASCVQRKKLAVGQKFNVNITGEIVVLNVTYKVSGTVQVENIGNLTICTEYFTGVDNDIDGCNTNGYVPNFAVEGVPSLSVSP